MTTLKEIGRQLGLSVTTVSRALNGFPEVGEQTRSLVIETARAMNYQPNQAARKLVTGRSGLVGLLLNTPQQLSFYGHFFEVVQGLSEAFSKRDIDLVLNVCPGSEVIGRYRRMIRRGTIDGFVLTGPEVHDPRARLLLEHDFPFVVHGITEDPADYPYYDIDNFGVGYRSAALLIDLGHRRIGFIGGPERMTHARERLRGYRQALADRGLREEPALALAGDASEAQGVAAAGQLFDGPAARPTAVICTNVLVASGLYRAALERGLSIPGDVSVVAHDDCLPQLSSAAFVPALTVTRAPLREASDPLADLLVRRIAGEPVSALKVTRDVDLVRRGSTGPAPRGPAA